MAWVSCSHPSDSPNRDFNIMLNVVLGSWMELKTLCLYTIKHFDESRVHTLSGKCIASTKHQQNTNDQKHQWCPKFFIRIYKQTHWPNWPNMLWNIQLCCTLYMVLCYTNINLDKSVFSQSFFFSFVAISLFNFCFFFHFLFLEYVCCCCSTWRLIFSIFSYIQLDSWKYSLCSCWKWTIHWFIFDFPWCNLFCCYRNVNIRKALLLVAPGSKAISRISVLDIWMRSYFVVHCSTKKMERQWLNVIFLQSMVNHHFSFLPNIKIIRYSPLSNCVPSFLILPIIQHFN